MRRYYLLLCITFVIATLLSYTQSADRSPTSLVINSILFAVPLGLLFLVIDYALTILERHTLMKYLYFLVLLFVVTFLPSISAHPLVPLIKPILSFSLFISIIGIAIYFFIRMAHEKDEEHVTHPHAMHKIAHAYQKQKESKDPWEVQFYDYFAAKIQTHITRIRKKRE